MSSVYFKPRQEEKQVDTDTLASAICPPELIARIQKNKMPFYATLQTVQLLTNVALEAFEAMSNGRLDRCDALVGHRGCELITLKLFDLAHDADLKKEAEELAKQAHEIQELCEKMVVGKANVPEAAKFFQEKAASLSVSKNLTFLLQARLLTITKEDDESAADGEKTEPSNLYEYVKIFVKPEPPSYDSNRVHLSSRKCDWLRKIVEVAQNRLSKSSSEYLACEVRKLQTAESPLVRRVGPDGWYNKHGKTMGCAFYKLQGVGLCLLERPTAIYAVKQQVSKKTPAEPPLLFKMDGSNKCFQISEEECIQKDWKKKAVVVIEGKRLASPAQVANRVASMGIYRFLLTGSGGMHYPFDAKPAYPITEAEKDEINSYSDESINCRREIFEVDHMYCSNLGTELSPFLSRVKHEAT